MLYSIASKKEVERYLRIFSTANKFAGARVLYACGLTVCSHVSRPQFSKSVGLS